MGAAPLVLEFVCIFVVTAFFIYRYGNIKKQHYLVTFAAFIAWYFSFLIVFILPLDVTSTIYRQCLDENAKHSAGPTPNNTTPSATNTSTLPHTTATVRSHTQPMEVPPTPSSLCTMPNSYVPSSVLTTLWRIIYWTSQVLTWLILPIMQSYSSAGNFSVAGKIKSALIENLIYYGTYAAIFIVCLIYVAANYTVDGDKLKVIGITASNTWGLFLLVLLLGYGLVDVPRRVWNNSKKGHLLSRVQFKVAKISTEKTEAEENLEDIFEETRQSAERIRYTNPLRKHMDTILEKLKEELGRNEVSCPESFRTSVRNHDDFQEYNSSDTDLITEKSLIQLHKKVIKYIRANHRTQVQWNMLMDQALELESVATNENNVDKKFKREASDVRSGFLKTYCSALYTPTIEWYVECCIKPWAKKALAIILTIMMLMVVWSECLFFVSSPVLSFFALFVDAAKAADAYWLIEIICILSITFLCWCAYHSIFQIKILNFYYIAPHHQTDERSLLFVGMMLCRLTPPMCLNFLGLIHMDSHVVNKVNNETSYTHIMGHMDVIPIISSGFNIYFPILILLLCVCTYFNLGSRLLHFVGIQQFIGDDDVTQDLVDEGKSLIRQEWRKRDRLQQGEGRRREWAEKFGDSNTASASYAAIHTRREKQKIPRRPTDNDKTNLLTDGEPVDFNDSYYSDALLDSTTTGTTGRYQSGSSTRPTRGIFDDV